MYLRYIRKKKLTVQQCTLSSENISRRLNFSFVHPPDFTTQKTLYQDQGSQQPSKHLDFAVTVIYDRDALYSRFGWCHLGYFVVLCILVFNAVIANTPPGVGKGIIASSTGLVCHVPCTCLSSYGLPS